MGNGDDFNAEIKLLSKEKYIESSIYIPKKQKKNAFFEAYRDKQNEAACAAFEEKSFSSGFFDLIFMLITCKIFFFFLAVAMLKNILPFDYLITGKQMRNNIEYELQLARKQEEIEYKPVYDPASFK